MLKLTSEDIYNELSMKLAPICQSDEDLKGVLSFIKSDKYRLKMIDFLNMANEKGNPITPDQILLLALKMSYQEREEGLR